MKKSGNLSRRKWLEQMSAPPIAVALGATMLRQNKRRRKAAISRDILMTRTSARAYKSATWRCPVTAGHWIPLRCKAAIDACKETRAGQCWCPQGDFVVGTT